MGDTYDFSGYATKFNIKCSDGKTIRESAFKHCDGKTVPLVWQHLHNNPKNVLGKARLKYMKDGIRAYCTFNNSPTGQNAKELVEHGDVNALSVYANQLKRNGDDVLHGEIREVSLVLAGANPGALIDSLILEHADNPIDDEAIIYTDELLTLEHSAEEKEDQNSDKETDTTEKKEAPKEEPEMADKEKTVKEVFDELTDEQKNVVYFMIGKAIENAQGKEDKDSTENKEDDGGNETMKHNVFDQSEAMTGDAVLSHSEIQEIFSDAKRFGSLRDSVLAHADEYGIKDIEWLFPDAKNITDKPGFIKRNPDGWVSKVMNGVHHTPFSRIKMMFADLREDDARAKGYTKGKLKKDEVFGLLKRVVTPTTIYKKQKLDRDDVIDITDFDVVAWLKGEMRMMLDEEIARAILFGDGRTALADDKISETNIIPICSDAALYTIAATVTPDAGESVPHAIINAAVVAQDTYEGSGNTTFFTANSTVTQMLLMEDKDGRRLYKDVKDIALAMNVKEIVTVPASIVPTNVYGVIVDLKDYNVGADKGGAVNMFDDFDIDYNQQKYLIETRCSGALTKPYSAVVLKKGE